MKRVCVLIVIVAMLGGMGACTQFSQKAELKTGIDSLSYYFGYSSTEGIKDYLLTQMGIDSVHMSHFYKGFMEGSKNYSSEDIAYAEGLRIAHLINNQWVENVNREIFLGDSSKTINRKAILHGFYHGVIHSNIMNVIDAQSYSQTKMDEIKEENMLKKYGGNKLAGEKFLAENKNKEGVKTTSSGLQYKIITEGHGDIPDENDNVKVHYRGIYLDGTEFESSYKDNTPVSFPVNQVLSGWKEAIKMMPVGSKWELYIPHDLAYGTMDRLDIPPYSTLIFEIELLEIER